MGNSPKFCPSCGTALSEGQRFCHECGAQITANTLEGAGSKGEVRLRESDVASSHKNTCSETSDTQTRESELGKEYETETQTEIENETETETSAYLDEGRAHDDNPVISGSLDTPDDSNADDSSHTNDVSCAPNLPDTPDTNNDSDSIADVEEKELRESDEDESIEDVSGIDISDGLQDDSFDAMKTAQIPLIPISTVPLVENPSDSPSDVSMASVGPGGTSPMPLITSEKGGTYAPSQDTQILETISGSTTAAPRQYRQDSHHQSNQSSLPRTSEKKHSALLVLVLVLALAVVVLAGLLVVTIGNNHQDNTVSSQGVSPSSQEERTASNDETTIDTTTEEPTTSKDHTYYQELQMYYDNLGSYHDEISVAASEFNSNYLTTDWAKRSSCAKKADNLADHLSNDYEALKELNIPASSEYYDCYTAQLTCYYDCLMRASVICEAWTLSLLYDDPTGHADEICEPLSRDKENGTNKYVTEFNKLYSSAQPAEPRA